MARTTQDRERWISSFFLFLFFTGALYRVLSLSLSLCLPFSLPPFSVSLSFFHTSLGGDACARKNNPLAALKSRYRAYPTMWITKRGNSYTRFLKRPLASQSLMRALQLYRDNDRFGDDTRGGRFFVRREIGSFGARWRMKKARAARRVVKIVVSYRCNCYEY